MTQDKVLLASRAGIVIRSMRDVSDALGASLESAGLILTETDVCADFFDLRTGLAGELFQKFANYKLRLCLVVAAPEQYGERFSELAREHAAHRMIRIVRTQQEAMAWLNG